jgi:hypothetical protein
MTGSTGLSMRRTGDVERHRPGFSLSAGMFGHIDDEGSA